MITKIISGGQTGADQGGLFGARDAGFKTGGHAPKNFMTERGSETWLAGSFGLVDSGLDYVGRTRLNVEYSDVTLWFGKARSPGYWATGKAAATKGKPFFEAHLVNLEVVMKKYEVVNIAGNRESSNPGIFEKTRRRVSEVLTGILAESP